MKCFILNHHSLYWNSNDLLSMLSLAEPVMILLFLVQCILCMSTKWNRNSLLSFSRTNRTSNDVTHSGFSYNYYLCSEQHSNICYHISMTSRTSNDRYYSSIDLTTSCIRKQHNNCCYHMVMSSSTSNDLYHSRFDL